MSGSARPHFTMAGATLLCLLWAMPSDAQYKAKSPKTGPATDAVGAGSSSDPVRIRRLSGLGRRGVVRTPEYSTSAARGTKPAGEWIQIEVEFDTNPEWIDELTVQYHVITLKAEDRQKRFSLYRNTVRYVDVERGRRHLSSMFLRPNTVKRYGDVVGIAVEVMQGGKVIAEASEQEGNMLPEKWWSNPLVIKSETVTARDGCLLDRAQTPFALINIDDYEAGK
jgi:hypothetical protein